MLILSRREAECICLGEDIVLTIVSVGNDKVRIGVKAPPGVRILRNELEIKDHTIPFELPESDQTQTTGEFTISAQAIAPSQPANDSTSELSSESAECSVPTPRIASTPMVRNVKRPPITVGRRKAA